MDGIPRKNKYSSDRVHFAELGDIYMDGVDWTSIEGSAFLSGGNLRYRGLPPK